MAHTDYYYEFGDHMPDGTPDTRWQTAPARGLNRTHDVLVNGAIGVMDGARAVKDFAGNTTFNPLPYGDYAQSAYNGIQNLYGNALDNGMNSVIDYVNPQPDMMSGGPMSRNGYRHYPGGYVIPANASLTEAAQEERDYQGFNGRAGHPHTPANYPDRPEFSREYHDDKRKNSQKPKSDWEKLSAVFRKPQER